MTDRVASTTAVLVCQGRATAHGRLAVGTFSDPVAEQLLDPEEKVVVEQARAQQPPQGAPGRIAYELVRPTAVLMVPRTVAIDDAVRHHGAGQVVMLAVDLEHDPLATALKATEFDPTLETTWVWEGVVPYLTADAVAETVRRLAELSAPGSVLIVNHQSRSLTASLLRRVMRVVMRLTRQDDPLAGEPWRSTWSPDTMRDMMAHNGFAPVSDDDLLTLASGLGLPHDADSSLRNGRVAVAVRR